jgi:hypothetical protein
MFQIIDGLENLESTEYLMDEFTVYQYLIIEKQK